MKMFQYGKYIYAVYKERSFSKAADKLFITQPSLSITIKKAESELGLPIFNRQTTPISLTPFGAEYIQALEQIHSFEQQLKNFVEKESTLQSGHLSVGSSNLDIDYIVTEWLANFHHRYPQIDLSVRSLNTMQVKHLLDSGEVDFVITNRPYGDKRYEQKVCYRECLVLAVPAHFDINEKLRCKQLRPAELGDAVFGLPKKRTVKLSAFAEVPFILLSGHNYLRQCTDLLFRESHMTPHVILELEQSATSYNFARLGVGATILSNRIVQKNADSPGLCFYKIDSGYTKRDAFLSYRRNVYFTFAMQRFEQMILRPEKEQR